MEDGASPLNVPAVAVVGGGYAGMAAAVELADAGLSVQVFEAAPELGGRARRITHRGLVLDNGLHIGIGAYSSLLALGRRVRPAGGRPDDGWHRRPLDWQVHGGIRMRAPRLPAPLHLAAALVGASGLQVGARLDALRLMLALRRSGYRVAGDLTVGALLAQQRQRPAIVEALWAPLCIAALNTPVQQASAQVFASVLRDSLGAAREASDLLLPATDLSALFPDPAATHVEARGGSVHRGHRVERVERVGPAPRAGRSAAPGWRLHFAQGRAAPAGPFAAVVLALPPRALAELTAGWPELQAVHDSAAALRHEPITSVYLQYPGPAALAHPMTGLAAGPGQWVFDRAALAGQPGLLGVVISASAGWRTLEPADLAAAVHEQLRGLLPGLTEPSWTKVIHERHATFACTPGLPRPPMTTAVAGVVLAGDHVAGDYPATLEGAVRSGQQAATAVLAHIHPG